MALEAGTKLGLYEILEPIGAGGMGEVYRARDTKLGREVAIKVLPEAFAENEERLARFEREARLLASLNHPNIATLYGFEQLDEVHFLVMELADGETLAERLRRGPIPVEDALPIFKQIAEALEAAHEKGIIHRDLKPANITVSSEGKVKVLDFGLAKAMSGDPVTSDLSESPTVTKGTATGVILGTAPYMSPEQARGKIVDKRTDIWAFGCCLYETLTGRVAFLAETVPDTIAKILEREPDWQMLPDSTPPGVLVVLRRCLQKDANQRLHDIADARIELAEALAGPWKRASAEVSAIPKRRAVAFFPVGLVVVVAIAASVVVWKLAQPTQPPPRGASRFVINIPPESPLADDPIAISPDGRQLVYATSGDSKQLYLRAMNWLKPTLIPGTEGARVPFFSPDGQWVGFFAEGKLKKVPLAGGATLTVCDAEVGYGASWGTDNAIIFAPTYTAGLLRVSASGGTPEEITSGPSEQGVLASLWPEVLPGTTSVLLTILTGAGLENMQIAVLSMGTGERRILVEGGAHARYASSGHIVYARGSSLLAAPFDIDRLEVTGPPVRVLEGVEFDVVSAQAQFGLSREGSLVYVRAQGAPEHEVLWADRQGNARPIQVPPRTYFFPSLSPDGQRLAMTNIDESGMETWILEMDRGALTRFTFEGSNHFSLWTPDGKRLTFSSDRDGSHNLFWKPADGIGGAERLVKSESHQDPGSWSPDGKALAFAEFHSDTKWDIWLLHMEGERRARPFLQTEVDEYHPMISPDGRWLAYTSTETGRLEVYVQPFPDGGRKWLISTEGGDEPLWAPSGRELFYRNGDKMMSVAVATEPLFDAERPRLLFETPTLVGEGFGSPNYDITPDGQRFLMIKPEPQRPPTQILVVLNWFEELKRLVPTN